MGIHPLEPGPKEMRELMGAATDFAVRFISSLPDAPAGDTKGAFDLAKQLSESFPPSTTGFPELLEIVEAGAMKSFNTTGPGYLAFIPGGGLFAAAVADFIACIVNRFVNLAAPSPGLVQLEYNVIRWLCDLFDLPETSMGILTSGGSISNFSAIVAARVDRLGEEIAQGTIYVSDQVHRSVTRAAQLAGLPKAHVRSVPVTPELRMDIGVLGSMIGTDEEAGLKPFMVVASAGTTNTGAIDPIEEMVELARRYDAWLHVDAAYGGLFQMTERGRALFRGIEKADSITLDPHKTMFLPYGTGCLLVRDRSKLHEAHRMEAPYLQDLAHGEDLPNFTDYSAELSRDFRGLRIWLPLKLYGIEAFAAQLDEKLDLAGHFYESLVDEPGFELPWEPELTIVPFRFDPGTGDQNAFNKALLDKVNASQRVFLSSTMIDGLFTPRVCIVSHRTHRDRIDEAIAIVRDAARSLSQP
jgi:aromatic-L-amino-acid/L-tryptophan decarboxylase